MLSEIYILTLKSVRWLAKFVFWFIFACIMSLLLLCCMRMLEQRQLMTAEIYTLTGYIVLLVGFIGSLFISGKIYRYILATGIIVFFLWVTGLPELSAYFGYFNME